MSIGNFPESLSQTILVGRLGVELAAGAPHSVAGKGMAAPAVPWSRWPEARLREEQRGLWFFPFESEWVIVTHRPVCTTPFVAAWYIHHTTR